ncbi:MAG: O-antigen ligase family protein [Actinomycetota bacterium]
MTTYRRALPDAFVAGSVVVAAVGLGVLAVKTPLLAIAGFGVCVMVVAGAVDPTLPSLAWLTVAPFVQALDPGSPLLALTIAFHRALLPIVAVGTLLGDAVRRRLRLSPAEKLLLVFLAYGLVSLVMTWRGSFSSAIGAEAARTFLLSYVVPFGALVIAIRLPAASHRKVFAMLALAAAAISVGGILQNVAGVAVFPGAAVWQEVWKPRAVGALANPAVSAYVAQTGIFVAIYLAFRHPVFRVVAIPAVVAGTVFTILTYTRSAWLALALGVVAIAWLYSKARPWVVAFVVVAVAAFSLNVGGFVDESFLEERAGNQENVQGRVAFGSTGFRMFKDQPLVGQGFGAYDTKAREFAAGFGAVGAGVAVADTSHNSFLTILAELGLIGFALYAGAIFFGVRKAVAALRRPRPGVDRLKIVVLLAGVLSYLVSANLIDMRFFSFAVSLFWFTVGLVITTGEGARDAAGS